MKYLKYCYLCSNNKNNYELHTNPKCNNCTQFNIIYAPTNFKPYIITYSNRMEYNSVDRNI